MSFRINVISVVVGLFSSLIPKVGLLKLKSTRSEVVLKNIQNSIQGICIVFIIIIETHLSVPFRGPPRYNPRRRSGLGWGVTLSRLGGPPSPCPSDRPFSSTSSEGSSSHRSHEDDVSIVTGIFTLFALFIIITKHT